MRKALYQMGFYEDSRDWSTRATTLGALTGDDLAFALADVARDPDGPDFSRLGVEVRPGPSAERPGDHPLD